MSKIKIETQNEKIWRLLDLYLTSSSKLNYFAPSLAHGMPSIYLYALEEKMKISTGVIRKAIRTHPHHKFFIRYGDALARWGHDRALGIPEDKLKYGRSNTCNATINIDYFKARLNINDILTTDDNCIISRTKRTIVFTHTTAISGLNQPIENIEITFRIPKNITYYTYTFDKIWGKDFISLADIYEVKLLTPFLNQYVSNIKSTFPNAEIILWQPSQN